MAGAKSPVGPWAPCGVITWTTDFGLQDGYVGTMHGVALRALATAKNVDITHGVGAQDVAGGALQLRHAWPYFPAGSVHVAVVDPGVGTERGVLVARQDGHAFVAPDNGLLAGVLDPERAQVISVDADRFALPERSATFHGRDVFAPLAAALAAGLDPVAAGSPRVGWAAAAPDVNRRAAAGELPLAASVIWVDRFGNAVTDLEPARAGLDMAGLVVELNGVELPVVETYGLVDPGSPLALVDSWGHLEVAVRNGDAARDLGLARGSQVTLRRRR